MIMEEAYEILSESNLTEDIILDEEDIKKKYRILMKKYHPDLCPEDEKEFCDNKSKEVNAARDLLISAIKRGETRIHFEKINLDKYGLYVDSLINTSKAVIINTVLKEYDSTITWHLSCEEIETAIEEYKDRIYNIDLEIKEIREEISKIISTCKKKEISSKEKVNLEINRVLLKNWNLKLSDLENLNNDSSKERIRKENLNLNSNILNYDSKVNEKINKTIDALVKYYLIKKDNKVFRFKKELEKNYENNESLPKLDEIEVLKLILSTQNKRKKYDNKISIVHQKYEKYFVKNKENYTPNELDIILKKIISDSGLDISTEEKYTELRKKYEERFMKNSFYNSDKYMNKKYMEYLEINRLKLKLYDERIKNNKISRYLSEYTIYAEDPSKKKIFNKQETAWKKFDNYLKELKKFHFNIYITLGNEYDNPKISNSEFIKFCENAKKYYTEIPNKEKEFEEILNYIKENMQEQDIKKRLTERIKLLATHMQISEEKRERINKILEGKKELPVSEYYNIYCILLQEEKTKSRL